MHKPKLTLAVVALTALGPFAFLLPPVSQEVPRFAALLLTAAAWLAVWASGGLSSPDAESRSLLTPVAAVAAFALVSALISFSPGMALTYGAEASLLGLPSWLAMLVVFVLASRAPLSRETHAGLEAGALLAAAMGAWAITQAARGLTTDAIFGNADYLGIVLLLFLPVAVVSLWRARAGVRVGVATAASTVLAVAAAASGVVTVIVALVAELLLLAGVTPVERLPKSLAAGRKPAAVAGFAVLGVGTASIALGALRLALPNARLLAFAAPIAAQTTFLSRFELWRAAAAAWLAHPLLGTGPDGLWLASQSAVSSRLMALEGGVGVGADVLVRDPHALPLLVLAQLGAVGALALAWLAFAWVRTLRRRIAEEPALEPVRRAYAVGAVAFLFAMLLIPWTVRFGAVPALLAGLAVAPAGAREKGGRSASANTKTRAAGKVAAKPGAAVSAEIPMPPAWAWAVAGVALLGALALGGAAVAGDLFIGRAKAARTPATAAAAYRQAIAVQPTRPYPRYELLYLQGFELAADGVGTVAAYRSAVDAAPKEILGNGPYLGNLVQPALDFAQVSGSRDLTWETRRLAEAVRLAPDDPDVVLESAHLALLKGDLTGAAGFLGRIRAEKTHNPRFALYEALLARARKERGAGEALRRAVQVAPYLEYLAR